MDKEVFVIVVSLVIGGDIYGGRPVPGDYSSKPACDAALTQKASDLKRELPVSSQQFRLECKPKSEIEKGRR